jgi:hypothetical protein
VILILALLTNWLRGRDWFSASPRAAGIN